MPEFNSITQWTLQQEIPIPDDASDLLVEGEQAVAAYKTFRDSAIFTTQRLIIRDAQGIRGKKVEIYSSALQAHQHVALSENAGGMLDINAELGLLDPRRPHQGQPRQEGIDVRRLDKLIAWAVLQAG